MLLLTACLPIEEERLPPPTLQAGEPGEFQTHLVERGDVIVNRHSSVTIVPLREEDLSFPMNNLYIINIAVSEGDYVHEGDIIAELDPGSYPEALIAIMRDEQWIELDLKFLAENYAFDQSQNGIAGLRVDDFYYTSEHEALLLELEILRVKREYFQYESDRRILRAPMDGVVSYVMDYREGARTVADERIATISDQSEQVFMLRGSDADLVNVGDILEIYISGDLYMGRVADADEVGTARPSGESERYIILLDDAFVYSEGNAYANIIIDISEDTLYVPRNAVKRVESRVFVYVLEDGVRRIRDIEIGLESGTFIEVLSGLVEGELVVP